MGFSRILVAVDASPQASVVFEQALELAKKNYPASLMIFHYIELDAIACPSAVGVKTEQTQRLLQSYLQQARHQSITAEASYQVERSRKTLSSTLYIGKSICHMAKDWDADLIVLGKKNCKNSTEFVLISVSDYAIYYSHCPVFLIQDKAFNSYI